jgi:hypothetical protein
MRFEVEHHFAGSVDAVVEQLTSAGFYCSLELPDLSLPSVLAESDDGDRSTLKLRYEFVGSLDPLARRMLGSHRLAWDQTVVVDRRTRTGQIEFAAAADPRRLHGSARFDLQPEGKGCVRALRGAIVVAVPVIGTWAEARIVPGMLRRLDIEASALDTGLRDRR